MPPIDFYFNVADELDGGLTLEDLDEQWVQQARNDSAAFDLPWPPDLAAAEEFMLERSKARHPHHRNNP